jgi:hypothetical protein
MRLLLVVEYAKTAVEALLTQRGQFVVEIAERILAHRRPV